MIHDNEHPSFGVSLFWIFLGCLELVGTGVFCIHCASKNPCRSHANFNSDINAMFLTGGVFVMFFSLLKHRCPKRRHIGKEKTNSKALFCSIQLKLPGCRCHTFHISKIADVEQGFQAKGVPGNPGLCLRTS